MRPTAVAFLLVAWWIGGAVAPAAIAAAAPAKMKPRAANAKKAAKAAQVTRKKSKRKQTASDRRSAKLKGRRPAKARPAVYILEVPPEIVADNLIPEMVPPVPDLRRAELSDSFRAYRSGGRVHRAIDISRPEGAPLVACVDGVIEKLHTSALGGTAIYLLDASGRYRFYYAHLSAYAEGLREGMPVARGTVIGYVGSTGNASATGPHLHFQIMQASNEAAVVNPHTVLASLVNDGVQAEPIPLVAPIPALPETFAAPVPAELVSFGSASSPTDR